MVRAFALTVGLWLAATASALEPGPWTIEAPPRLAGVATRLERLDQALITRALAQAGLSMPSHIRIVLVDAADPSARHAPEWVVGSAFGTDTIIIFPERIGAYPYGSLEAVLIHEIAHLALASRADGRSLPRWFHEGVAVSVESGWSIGSQVRLLWAAQQKPAIDEVSRLFASDSQPATTTAYLLSAALIEDIRRRHGLEVPGEIAARVAAGATFDDAFRAATGETTAQAAASAWRVYHGLRWLPLLTSSTSVWGSILALAVVAFIVRLRRRHERRRQWDAEERQEDASETGL